MFICRYCLFPLIPIFRVLSGLYFWKFRGLQSAIGMHHADQPRCTHTRTHIAHCTYANAYAFRSMLSQSGYSFKMFCLILRLVLTKKTAEDSGKNLKQDLEGPSESAVPWRSGLYKTDSIRPRCSGALSLPECCGSMILLILWKKSISLTFSLLLTSPADGPKEFIFNNERSQMEIILFFHSIDFCT